MFQTSTHEKVGKAGEGRGIPGKSHALSPSLSPQLASGYGLYCRPPPCTYAPSFSGAVKEAQYSSHVDTLGKRQGSIRGMHGFRYSPSKQVLSEQGLLAREGPSPLQATR